MTPANKLSANLVETDSGCWEFVGARDTKGYGNIVIDGMTKKAHRLSYEIEKGPIPHGLFVCHSCDNPPCCNPAHLFLGTNKDNVTDSVNKGRRADQAGIDNGNRKLNEHDVRMIRYLFDTKQNTIKELSSMYNVSSGCIGFIVRRESWRHVQ